jgi:hypothetical protein
MWALDILIVLHSERGQSKCAAIGSILASIQFGLRANLVRCQFESGLDSADRQNRDNERSCPMAISIGRRNKLEKGKK